MDLWSCYIIFSLDTSKTYIGATNNPEKRLNAHNNKGGAKYTRGEKWIHLLIINGFINKNACLSFESGFKKIAKNRTNSRFDVINLYYNTNLKYTNDTKYNRILDLLYFVHNITFIGYKFMINYNIQHPVFVPPVLYVKVIFEDLIKQLPWPYFVILE